MNEYFNIFSKDVYNSSTNDHPENDIARVIACSDVDRKRMKEGKEHIEMLHAKNSGKKKGLPDDIFKAIKVILIEMAKNQRAIPADDSKWQVFIDKSRKKAIQATIKDIRDVFINEVDITPAQFLFCASFFEEYGGLKSRAGDIVRRILAKVITDPASLAHIISQMDFYTQIVNDAKDDASDFKESLREQLQADPKNTDLLKFASKVGVKPNAQNKE